MHLNIEEEMKAIKAHGPMAAERPLPKGSSAGRFGASKWIERRSGN